MRTLLSILMIATVLLCPFDCAVKRALARSAAEMECASPPKACCSACAGRHHENETAPVAPDSEPKQDGRTCVCGGAILASVEHATKTFSLPVLTWATIDTPTADCRFGVSVRPIEDGIASTHGLGRDMRISMRSLIL